MNNSIFSKKFVSYKTVLTVHYIIVLLLLCLYGLFVILNIFISEPVLLTMILLCFLWSYFSASCVGIKYYHPYRLFLLIFFLYNLSGFYVCLVRGDSFFNYPFDEVSKSIYNEYTKQVTLYSIIYFISFVHLGVLFYCNIIQFKSDYTYTWVNDKKMEKIGLAVFFIFLLPAAYYYYLHIIEAILLGGYANYALSDKVGTTNANYLVRISDDMFTLGFAIFLAAKPDNKKLIMLTIIYIIPFLATSIFTGSRVYFIIQMMMLITYYSMRGILNKRKFFTLLVICGLIAAFLGFFRASKDFSVYDTLNLINTSEENSIELSLMREAGSTHTTGMTVAYVDDGKIDYSLKYLFFPLFTSGGFDPNKAIEDYYTLADRLSVLTLRDFDFGAGIGSSIVAEFYACGGVIAIIFLSMLWGFCVMMISNPTNNYRYLLFLILLPGIYYTARAHPLTSIIFSQKSLILAILFIYFYKHFKQVRFKIH